MGRQRTIDDQNFWRSPKIADCTQEDRATMLYLLTSPSSNIIGVYPVVPRISAAEMGWNEDQFILVIKRLSGHGLINFNESTRFLWVKQWWEHNSARMAMGPKLRGRTTEQLLNIPSEWGADYCADLISRLPERLGRIAFEIISTGKRYEEDTPTSSDTLSDRVSAKRRSNVNSTFINNAITQSGNFPKARETNGTFSSPISQGEMQKIRASFHSG